MTRGRPYAAATWHSRCRGKVQYTSKRAALGALRVLHAQGRTRLDAYRCESCHRWHLGNRSPPPAPLKTMRVAVGDTVEIVWRHLDGREVRTRHFITEEDFDHKE